MGGEGKGEDCKLIAIGYLGIGVVWVAFLQSSLLLSNNNYFLA